MSRGRSLRSSDTRGQGLAEFAIVIPVVLLLFMAVFDLARAAYFLNTIGDAARNGVREAIVNQDCPAIEQRARFVAPGVDLSASTAVQVTVYRSSVVSNSPAPDTCAGGLGGGYGIGYLAEVRVNATFTPITPVISNLIGPIPLTSTARLPLERAYP